MGLQTGADVAIAFALVIGAGLSTTIGAAFAFCGNIANENFLAISLGVSAGVMIYVSFVEIFSIKAIDGFIDANHDDDAATRYATFCFFGGIIITAALDAFVHFLMHHAQKRAAARLVKVNSNFSDDSLVERTGNKDETNKQAGGDGDVEHGSGRCGDCSAPAANIDIEAVRRIAEKDSCHNLMHLRRLGLMSGLAIALHNFPEGLATFVSALADKTSGVAIAFAIAVHNIPEGIVVAVPVYYATKSRVQGFFWAFMSGVSEPIGGLLGWVVLSNMGDIIYAIMFGIVAGMMVYISMKELIPTALRFDPEDHYVMYSLFVGMAIMAISLLLFAI